MHKYTTISAGDVNSRITAATAALLRASSFFLERSMIRSGSGFMRPFETAAEVLLEPKHFTLARLRGYEHLSAFLLAASSKDPEGLIECKRPLTMHGDNRFRAEGVLKRPGGDALINLYCRAHDEAPRLDISVYDMVPNGKVSIDSIYYLGSDYIGGPGIHLDIGDSHRATLKWLSHLVFKRVWPDREDFLGNFVMGILSAFSLEDQ